MSCEKKCFTKGQAISAVNKAKRIRNYKKKSPNFSYCRRNEVDYYYCQFCDSYHVTSEKKHNLRFKSKKEYTNHKKALRKQDEKNRKLTTTKISEKCSECGDPFESTGDRILVDGEKNICFNCFSRQFDHEAENECCEQCEKLKERMLSEMVDIEAVKETLKDWFCDALVDSILEDLKSKRKE